MDLKPQLAQYDHLARLTLAEPEPSCEGAHVSADKTLGESCRECADAWQAGTYEWWPSSDRLSWSPELIHLYGLKQAPTREDGFSALVHPEDRVRVEGETSTYLGSDLTTYSHRFRIVRPDGAVRVILDRGAVDRDAAGNVRVIRGLNSEFRFST